MKWTCTLPIVQNHVEINVSQIVFVNKRLDFKKLEYHIHLSAVTGTHMHGHEFLTALNGERGTQLSSNCDLISTERRNIGSPADCDSTHMHIDFASRFVGTDSFDCETTASTFQPL